MSTPSTPEEWWDAKDWARAARVSRATAADAFAAEAAPQIIAYLLASGMLSSLLALERQLGRIAAALEGLEAGR